MHRPATPARSYSATVRMTLMALPNPLSQSAMTGTVTAVLMRRTASNVSLMVRMLASGIALAAEIQNPLAHTASKPASSASFADNASWTPKTSAGPGRRSNVRKRAAAEGIDIVRKLYERGHRPASTRAREKGGLCSWTRHGMETIWNSKSFSTNSTIVLLRSPSIARIVRDVRSAVEHSKLSVDQMTTEADFAEGVAAFTQKRLPRWTGRA